MIVRQLGFVDYAATLAQMQTFTAARNAETEDELWLCEHPPVYTQGVAGKAQHLLSSHTNGIPVVQSDRGGQITYHGPGQLVAYPLVNLHRLGIFVKEYVFRIEAAVLSTLASCGITGHRVSGAPGIYVRVDDPFSHAVLPKGDPKQPDFAGLGKIAALGIKVSKGCTYHGVSLNIQADLLAFAAINACGYAGLQTVNVAQYASDEGLASISEQLAKAITARLAC